MSLVTFIPNPNYSGVHGVINRGDGGSFDIGQALSDGGGEIQVDSLQNPLLAETLLSYPGLIVQGTSPGSLPTQDVLSTAEVHSLRQDKSAPQIGDVLTRTTSDGSYHPAAPAGGIAEVVNTVATSGAAQTIPDPMTGVSRSYITLTANCTFTLPADPSTGAAASFMVQLKQDATGGRVPTFTGAKWANRAGPPGWSAGAGAIDIVYGDPVVGGGWILTPILNVG